MKHATKLIVLLATVAMLCSCGASSQERKAAKAAEEAQYAKQIDAAMNNLDFTIEINRIIPRSFPSKSTQDGYTLQYKDGLLTCYLPYFGTARTAVFGNEEVSIVADKQEVQMNTDFTKSGQYRMSCKVKSGNVMWNIVIQVFNNGLSSLDCTTDSRDGISYQGEIVFDEKK